MLMAQTAVPAASTAKLAQIDPAYIQIRDLVYKVSGIYQLEERLHLLADGCGRRMEQLNIQQPRAYWDYLTSNPDRDGELRLLLNELTVGETCLFRSQSQLDALNRVILPELMEDKTRQLTKKLRVWSAGCSTGEEPYTLAMTLMEQTEGALKGWQFEIAATDLNDRSVETAKTGAYGDYALRNTPELFRKKYFQATETTRLQIKPEIRKLVAFQRLNLQDDSQMLLMKGFDLIFCCNVLIYFDGASKARTVTHFYNNLNFGGYLFLGTSESLLQMNSQFHLVHFPGTIGYWKPSPARKK